MLVCSQNSAVSKVHQEQWVRNVLLVDAQSIDNSFWARTFCHLTSVYQLKKYEYPQLAPAVSASSPCTFWCSVDIQFLISCCVLQVLRDERLRLAIEAAAQYDYSQTDEKNDEVYKGIVQKHKARATKILYDMRSTLSDFLLRYSDSLWFHNAADALTRTMWCWLTLPFVSWMCVISCMWYRISRPIRHPFFPQKCDLNSTCVLCAMGKYYFQTYKYPYIYCTISLLWDSEICFQIMRSRITACEWLICFQIMRSRITACEWLTSLSRDLP